MNEPAVAMHVFEITPENMGNLANWQFPSDTPVTKFQNVTFNLDLKMDLPSFRTQLQLTQNFLPRFTSAVIVEIYFGKNVGGRNNVTNSLDYQTIRASYHYLKRAMNNITILRSIEICHGKSFEHRPEARQGWEKNPKGNWGLPLTSMNYSANLKYKDDEMEKHHVRESSRRWEQINQWRTDGSLILDNIY